MDFSDEVKRLARLAAQGVKDALRADTLEAKDEKLPDVTSTSPQTPGYALPGAHTAQEKPQWPQAREVEPAEQDRERDKDKDLDR